MYIYIYIWRRAGYVQQKYLPPFNGIRGKLSANRRQTDSKQTQFRTIQDHLGSKILDTKIVHTSKKKEINIFFWVENIFKPCSHIQKNTQNPNPIFKITIY